MTDDPNQADLRRRKTFALTVITVDIPLLGISTNGYSHLWDVFPLALSRF